MNLAQLHEAIAAAIPQRECLLEGEKTWSWADITDRSRRLAQLFKAHQLGCHTPRDQLQNWQSGQDHIALYLHNSGAYLESMLAAFKARCVPFNVNYRYQANELAYLFKDAQAKVVVFHARFTPIIETIKDCLPNITLWLQVDDDSGEPLPAWALDYEQALLEYEPAAMDQGACDADLFMIYTGGTTGMPKGVLWTQHDIYQALISNAPESIIQQDVVRRIEKQTRVRRGLPLPPFMHASGQCVAFGYWFMGMSVVIPEKPQHFTPPQTLNTIERHKITSISIVGDGFAVPLLQELQKNDYDLTSLRIISSGGAALSSGNKQLLKQHAPNVIILDVLGSSESGRQAQQLSHDNSNYSTDKFSEMESSVVVDKTCAKLLSPGSDTVGYVASSGNIALGYLNDEAKTQQSFPVIDSIRYAVPGDQALWQAAGGIRLLGRGSFTINSGGEKIFAEEVENTIKTFSGVLDTAVVGIPSERWGQQVTALFTANKSIDIDALKQHCHQHLADYKTPKQFFLLVDIGRGPNGKLDYKSLKQLAIDLSAEPAH